MCTGIEIAALAGTGIQMANQANTQRKQAQEMERARRASQLINDAAGRRVNEEIQKVSKSTPDVEQQTAQQGFMDALKRSLVDGSGGLAGPGSASQRFSSDFGEAKDEGIMENARTARTLARIDAPVLQRQREGQAMAGAASDLSLIEGRGRGQDFLTQLRMSMIQPNAAADAAGNFLNSYAQARSKRLPGAQVGDEPRTAPSLEYAYDTPTRRYGGRNA